MKKFLTLFVSVMMILCLAGCEMLFHTDVEYDETGKGTVSIFLGYDDEFYEALEEYAEDEMVDEDAEELVPFTYNEKNYKGSLTNDTFASFEELNKLMVETLSEDEDTPLFDAFEAGPKGLTATVNADLSEGLGMAEYGEYGMTIAVILTVTPAGKITETNGTLSADGKSVTWDLLGGEKTLTMVTKSFDLGAYLPYIIAGGAALVLAIIVIALVSSSKKQKAAAASYDTLPVQDVPVQADPFEPDLSALAPTDNSDSDQ